MSDALAVPFTPAVKHVLARAHYLARTAADEYVRLGHLQAAINESIRHDATAGPVACARFTVKLECLSSESLNQAMIDYLREQGYFVEFPRNWETCVAFRRRVGITAKSLSEQLANPSAPRVDVQRGPTGRLKAIASNSRFEAFCVRHKKR